LSGPNPVFKQPKTDIELFAQIVKDFEFITDQNKQRNYKPPPIKFSNIFFGVRQATDPKENKRLQICLTEPASSSI